MDYRSIIKSRRLRENILRALFFIPDSLMLRLQYRIQTGRAPDLCHPTRLTEKLQCYKLQYRDPRMIPLVDKFDVRSFVARAGLEDILIPCFGVFDSIPALEAADLPGPFVLKDTLGSGGHSILFCQDSSHLPQHRKTLRRWLRTPRLPEGGREWPYYHGKRHRILAEADLRSPEYPDLPDYKFTCFHGDIAYAYVCSRRWSSAMSLHMVDPDYRPLSVIRRDHPPQGPLPEKPPTWDRMCTIARILSADFPQVRVDLYSLGSRVFFGELTFFDASGYMGFEPDSFDLLMGEKWILPDTVPERSGP